MTTAIIWTAALVLYIGFRLFYDGIRRPLSDKEVADYTAILDEAPYLEPQEKANIIAFMKQDDGKEFFMFNIGKFPTDKVTHPETGQQISGNALTQDYSKPFITALLKRAGHPYFMQRPVGGYIDSWDEDGSFPTDPNWSFTNFMRYRSRRDLMEMLKLTVASDIHHYKRLGMLKTFNFPATPMVRTHLGPRSAIFVLLALGASLLTNLIG